MPIIIERDYRGVVTAWLDNDAKKNAMNDEMFETLTDLLLELDKHHSARILVIRGKNGTFCSGRDLGELDGHNISTSAERLLPINRLARAFRHCSLPVISLIQGKAVGLGVSLICWSDIAIASESAVFSLPEARVGISPSITALSLIEVLGRRAAMDLCLTGRSIDASTALRIGLLQYICESSKMDSLLEKVVSSVIKGGPQSLKLTKQLSFRVEREDFNDALISANEIAEHSMSGQEISEGLAAFREKRLPVWVPK